MFRSDPLFDRLHRLKLARLGDDRAAGLLITSLPLPRHASVDLSLEGRPGYAKALGEWPGGEGPRRLLLVADGGEAPAEAALTGGCPAPAAEPPAVDMVFIGRNDDELIFWENHALKISWGGHAVECVMGLRTGGKVHWWQCCKLVVLEETPACRVVEMAGAIPLDEYGLDVFHAHGLDHTNPYLHKHRWLNGHIYARLHANGVCEMYAHHVNSKFFDDGLPLEDAVPVIGLRTETGCRGVDAIVGPWDGTRTGMTLGDVRFDMTDVAHLATPQQPGAVNEEKGFLVLQPYLGMEMFGGNCPTQLYDDPYLYHAEQRIIPRGAARTLRFSFSLSPDRSPRIARYLAPAWWYGVCEEFMPAPWLPVSNGYDEKPVWEREWLKGVIHREGFEDGSVPRSAKLGDRAVRDEPGWEGEVPYAQLLSAWRSGDPCEYDLALRSAYFINDVVVDHATNTYRMLGYPVPAIALPHARVLGSLAAFLETGDPYLYQTAEAVTEAAFCIHKNSWPRAAMGRDACFIRGAVMLYRYFNLDYFRHKARLAIDDVMAVQRPDGSFGDQAGGTGIHQWGMYITKPWMGCMAVNPLLDYLELFPEDEAAAACVKKFADWLMAERLERNGYRTWTYQHNFAGERAFINYKTGEIEPEALPTPKAWHMEYFARLLTFCAVRYRQPDYFAAWEESYRGTDKHSGFDHAFTTVMQFMPWLQASLWQARLTPEGITIDPAWFGDSTPATAQLLTPDGPVAACWQDGRPVLGEPAAVPGAG